MLPGGMELMMSRPNATQYLSSPPAKHSKAPYVSNTAPHWIPVKRSSLVPPCAYCGARRLNCLKALCIVGQFPFAAAPKRVLYSGSSSCPSALAAVPACAAFSATNDFIWAETSDCFRDQDEADCFLAQPVANPRQM